MSLLYEFPQGRWKQAAELTTDHFLVSLPNNAGIDDSKADDCEDEWKHHTVLEYIVG